MAHALFACRVGTHADARLYAAKTRVEKVSTRHAESVLRALNAVIEAISTIAALPCLSDTIPTAFFLPRMLLVGSGKGRFRQIERRVLG